ncbi:MAG TPA: bifunctional hydroxymethylpyrimidine kinase/phosphomethylpyrimidine kinase [Bryobacteraceae bacterium]|nr:bifunctional hydroxymethylpyrimidine kinase/phosphomethylpyrimidine kinase [Bryobacteraceae bacterium]
MTPVALTIAGSDPSGGAGLQADLKTFHRFEIYGEAVVTLITVQNTRGVTRVDPLTADLVAEQIRAVLEDIAPHAAKTGALGSKEVVSAVADAAAAFKFPLVVDPVMTGKHGARFLDDDSVRVLIERLIPRAFLLTPNLDEAAALAGLAVNARESMIRAAKKLIGLGAANVLVKGGHLPGDALDILYTGAGEIHEFTAARVATPHTHGSGCTYSAAITAELARGTPVVEAVRRAKDFVTRAILTNPGLGGGQGPLNHHA